MYVIIYAYIFNLIIGTQTTFTITIVNSQYFRLIHTYHKKRINSNIYIISFAIW